VRFVPPHFFVCEKLLRSFLIANKKTSFTCSRYTQMIEMTEKLSEAMRELADLSRG
jgi:hypothetical protein